MTGEAAEVYTKSVQEAADESEIEVEKVVGKVLRGASPMILPFR